MATLGHQPSTMLSRIVSVSAWTVLGFTAIGVATTAARPAELWQSLGSGLGGLVGVVILLLFGTAAVTCWLGSVLHAATSDNWDRRWRLAVALGLLAGNFPAALVYYFVVVRGRNESVRDVNG